MERKMPSQEEQDAVVWYVLKRPLTRPNTSYRKAALCVLLFLAANVAMTILLFHLFDLFGIFSYISDELASFRIMHPAWCAVLVGVMQFSLGGILVCRKAAIGAIKLYQRYAPEDIRRKCLFKPTCSEYAILAIKKYGLIIGLIKTYNRLFKRCKGRIYTIDYP
jgi:putative component of membrane protein insertase Oxa1/YidC/SpoIIIJ protein YidD